MLCEALWCQSAGSERTDLAAEVSLGLHCRVALRLRRPHRWNQAIKLLRLALGHALHVCWALLDSIDIASQMLWFGKAHHCEHKSDQTATTACSECSENVRIISAIARRINMELCAMSG